MTKDQQFKIQRSSNPDARLAQVIKETNQLSSKLEHALEGAMPDSAINAMIQTMLAIAVGVQGMDENEGAQNDCSGGDRAIDAVRWPWRLMMLPLSSYKITRRGGYLSPRMPP